MLIMRRLLLSLICLTGTSCRFSSHASHVMNDQNPKRLTQLCAATDVTLEERAAMTWLQTTTVANDCAETLQWLTFIDSLSYLDDAAKDGQAVAFNLLLDFYRGTPRVTAENMGYALYSLALYGKRDAFHAVQGLDTELAQHLDYSDHLIFMAAITSGSTELVQELMHVEKLDINRGQILANPLYLALSKGHGAIASLLLADRRIDLDEAHNPGEFTYFGAAVQGGLAAIIRQFNQLPAFDVNATKYRQDLPLSDALQRGNADVVNALLENNSIEVNRLGLSNRSPLFAAVASGRMEMVELLLADSRILPNQTPNAYTGHALAFAAEQGQDAIALRLYSDPRFDRHLQMSGQQTLLHKSAHGGSVGLTRRLLQDGFDRNAVSEYGWTPLLYAGLYKQPAQVLDLLAQENINVGAVERENGRNILHWAAANNLYDVVKYILDHKLLNPTLPDGKDMDAEYLANRSGYNAIKKLISDYLDHPVLSFAGALESSLSCIANYQPDYQWQFLQGNNGFFEEVSACGSGFQAYCVAKNLQQYGRPQRAIINRYKMAGCLNSNEVAFLTEAAALESIKKQLSL